MAGSAGQARRLRSDGERSRRLILEAATALASTEGLEGLSIGRLAEHAQMSKSGLYAHFGSKQDLQLATIYAAEEIFQREVIEPAADEPAGVSRILAQVDAYLSYLQRRVFPGGCFFAVTAGEMGGREGPPADRLRELNEATLSGLLEELRQARDAGEIDSGADLDQLAFEIDSIMLGAHSSFLLRGDAEDLERTRRAVKARLS